MTPTPDQQSYVEGLRTKLRITTPVLDHICTTEFGKPYQALDRREVSRLLDLMTTWERLPAELQRFMGQQTLPGV